MVSNEETREDRERIERLYQNVRELKEYRGLLGFLNSITAEIDSSDKAKRFLKPYAPSLQERFRKSGERMLRFKEVSKLYDGERGALLKTFVYLGLFETSVRNIIDLILMLLISLHHDFYLPWGRKYARKLEDLDSAHLGEKLTFLNRHNLQIFSRNINKDLRNKIAHMDFDVDPDGGISFGNQKYDLENEIYRLMAFLLLVTATLEDSGVPKLLGALY